MTFSYFGRLACLALASFFLIHLALSLAARWATPAILKIAKRTQSRSAARWLFALRMAPVALALLLVAAFCVPSYLRFEPSYDAENVGLACLLASFCAIAILVGSCIRAMRHLVRTSRFLRTPRRTPLLAVAGILRPRLVISPAVVEALTADQLEVALLHEDAHRISRDNLKRLLILAVPSVLPGVNIFGESERAWARFTEWAADDHAVSGDSEAAVTLAEALVCVARLGTVSESPVTSFLGHPDDLSARIDRLLHGSPPVEKPTGRQAYFLAVPLVTISCAGAILLLPGALNSIHSLLENLVR